MKWSNTLPITLLTPLFLWGELTIVDPESHISDFEARLELAQILSRHEETKKEAVEQYTVLLKQKPQDNKLWLEISRLYIAQGKFVEASNILQALIKHHPLNADFFIKTFSAVQEEHKPSDHAQSLVEANDFISDDKARLELAKLLAKQDKTLKEAIHLYEKFLAKDPYNTTTLLEIGRLYIRQKKFHTALSYLYVALKIHNDFYLNSFSLGACKNNRSMLTQYDPQEKKHFEYRPLAILRQSLDHSDQVDLLVEAARAEIGLEHAEKAQALLLKALSLKQAESILMEEANVLMLVGSFYKAEAIYEQAVSKQPCSLDLNLSLAWTLVSAQRYEEAEELYKKLLVSHPQEPKIIKALVSLKMIEKDFKEALKWIDDLSYTHEPSSIQARFYQAGEQVTEPAFIRKIINQTKSPQNLIEWANLYAENGLGSITEFYEAALKLDPHFFPARMGLAAALSSQYRYDEALDIYLCLLKSFPEASKIMMEIARVLSWGKQYENSMAWYDQIIALNPQDPVPKREKARVAYWGKFYNTSMETYQTLVESPVEKVRKTAYLESTAKAFDWENKPLHALPIYEELAQVEPGNLEGLYGYAQDFCSLGLCNCSRRLYEHILTIAPGHDLVKMALERNLLLEHPLIQGNYTYWAERGKGQFANSQIARHRWDQVFQWPLNCRDRISFIQSEWLEYPFFKQKYYPAEGQTLEANYIFNGYLRGFASVGRKNYFHKFPTRYTYVGTLGLNLYDYANLSFGFERRNEIYNYFSLEQGIQADISWAALQAQGHAWTIVTTYQHFDYNDDNTLDYLDFLVSYALTEDPVVFKIILDASYRDTAHLSRIIISPTTGKLITIVHPYWTPRNYYAYSATLEFRYNYAWFTYCEAPQRYIDIKVTGGTDTTNNPSFQLAINWKHEWMHHWGFEMTGLYHRSKLWKADGIWTQVYYRF